MICENCKCKDECGWYSSYKRIENEIYVGVGTDNTLGRALLAAMSDNQLKQCEYFEIVESDNHTNADRIRNMSDDELASWYVIKCEIMMGIKCQKPYKTCKDCILEWLQSEAK